MAPKHYQGFKYESYAQVMCDIRKTQAVLTNIEHISGLGYFELIPRTRETRLRTGSIYPGER
jgi:hypothetical protein